ncbi:MAG: phosphoribosylglycinamide formyltransferase [Gammaproteobacteria bacterium]|jgi:phosphoribosylglycinamide formyltransferase 1
MPDRAAPLRVVVLISGNGSNLQAILDAADKEPGLFEVVAVISNREDAYGLERADKAGISSAVVDHRAYDSRESYDHALMQIIDGFDPELVVLAGFMRILTSEFVRHYAGRMLNIHPSLLPKYKGLDTHQRAIDAGDRVHGCSVHFVTEELDDGPVVLQAEVPVLENDTAETLAQRVHVQEHIIYPEAVRRFALGELTPGKA